MNIRNLIFVITLVAFFSGNTFAQKRIVFCEKSSLILQNHRKCGVKKKASDSTDLNRQLLSLVNYYHSCGYLTFAIDSVREDSVAYYIYPFVGEHYTQTYIRILPEDASWLENTAVHSLIKSNFLLLSDYNQFTNKLLRYLENNGYPFAEIGLDDITFEKDTFATLQISKNRYFTVDSLIVKGNLKLSDHFLFPYLSLRRKKKYDEHIVRQIPQRLNALPFATVIRTSGVEFVDDKAYLYLFLDKRKVNQFDGYLGLVPVNEKTGKVMFTGEVNLSLQNIFHIGEKLQLSWKSPEKYSQYLDVSAEFPYLFRTPFGVAGHFILDKKDTTYLNMNYLIALQYSFQGNNSLRTYFNYTSSSVLSRQTIMLQPYDSLTYDFDRTMYGIELNYKYLDNIHSPRRGVTVRGDFSVGMRRVRKSNEVEEDFFQAIDLETVRYRFMGEVAGYVPLHKRWTWVISANSGCMWGSSHLNNELFTIGGTRTLQGFDEMSLRASTYLIGSTELRFRFAALSYLNFFFNGGWYERVVSNVTYFYDTPWGLGIGANFDTKAGLFYISYALGQQRNSPLSFKTGKIHFGMAVHF